MVNTSDFMLQKNAAVPFPETLESDSSQGLPLNGISLVGPSSDMFGTNDTYQLPSFSLAFYMKWNKIEEDKVLSLIEIYAESPNHVSLEIQQTNESFASITVILGDK